MDVQTHQSLDDRLGQVFGAVESGPRIQSLWGGYGELVRYRVDAQPVVVKHVRAPPGQGTSHARKLRSYEVEQAWYAHWRPEVRVARALHLEAGLFVLEDLDAAGFAGRTRRVDDQQLQHCIEWLARFHRQFLGVEPDGLWPTGTYWHLATRPDELEAMAPGPLQEAAPSLDQKLSSHPLQTIVHGDAKAANFCFGEGVAAVDFQYVGRGVGVRDLVYLLGALAETRLERDHDRWVDHYFALIPEAEAWRELIPTCWADFERFLAGWSPGHVKRTGFAARMTRRALG